MKIDFYTKFVLTLIGVGLFMNSFKEDPVSKAFAQMNGSMRVELVVKNDDMAVGGTKPFEFKNR